MFTESFKLFSTKIYLVDCWKCLITGIQDIQRLQCVQTFLKMYQKYCILTVMNWWIYENWTQEQSQYTCWTIYKVYLHNLSEKESTEFSIMGQESDTKSRNWNKNMARNQTRKQGTWSREWSRVEKYLTRGAHGERRNGELCNRGERGYWAERQENDQRWVCTAMGCAYLQLGYGESTPSLEVEDTPVGEEAAGESGRKWEHKAALDMGWRNRTRKPSYHQGQPPGVAERTGGEKQACYQVIPTPLSGLLFS